MFGHHPDPETDFCVEVDVIQGLHADFLAGLEGRQAVEDRISNAMDFPIKVNTSGRCIAAREKLRVIRRELVTT